MRIVMFYHSLVSDWNNGNAHFLRGVAVELQARGHSVAVYEPIDGWSRTHLVAQHGSAPLDEFHQAFPRLNSIAYHLDTFDVQTALHDADLVLVHEWNDPTLIAAIGRHRRAFGGYQLFFHDTHHRSVSDRDGFSRLDLSLYDGIVVFGDILRQRYLAEGWSDRVWTWHEAADVRTFYPHLAQSRRGDVVWIGNWGDEERTDELEEFLIGPVSALGLRASVYGVRYPPMALERLARAGIEYRGWLPNYRVPEVFARFALTVHVPRHPYVSALPGIPTIRVFEALACGIPLVCAPWHDVERLFSLGDDLLIARSGAEMQRQLSALLAHPEIARRMARHGRQTILARHTCRHRVDELMRIVASVSAKETS